MNKKRIFRCRIEELPTIASFVLMSLERDQADFASFSTKFDTAFIESYREKIGQVNTITNREMLMSHQKTITRQLHEAAVSIRPVLLTLEGYISMSSALKQIDFGISKLRTEITNMNFEGVKHSTKVLLQLLEYHSDALVAEGMQVETIQSLAALLETVEENDLDQQRKMNELNVLVDENLDLFNELWEQMSTVMNIGKRIYKNRQSAKVDDYTLVKLKSSVNRERRLHAHEANAG